MKPAPFELQRPETLEEALGLLAASDDAKALAGGQSLVPLLNFRLARPEQLVDLDRIGRLAELRRTDDGLVIGAMVRQRRAERSLAVGAASPLLAAALLHVAHPPIRNRGTIGGSLAHADPAAELPAVACALDATMRVASVRGTREIPAREFFRTHLTTALEADELLTEIDLRRIPPRTGAAFIEVSRRRGDYAIVGVAVQLTLDDEGLVTDARICLSGVSDRPWRCSDAEASLGGAPVDERTAQRAAEAALDGLRPPGDIHASAAYRRDVTGTLVRRALQIAAARAEHVNRFSERSEHP